MHLSLSMRVCLVLAAAAAFLAPVHNNPRTILRAELLTQQRVPPEQLLRRATVAEDAGRTREAVRLLEYMTSIAPRFDARAWAKLSRLRRLKGDVVGARVALSRGVRWLPTSSELWRKHAELAKASGELDVAARSFARATGCADARPAAWDAWSRLETRRGDRRLGMRVAVRGLDALGVWRNATAFQTLPPSAKKGACRLFHALAIASGGGPATLKILERGLRCDPDFPSLNHAMGVELWRTLGDAHKARHFLRRAAVLEHPEALLSLARLEETDHRTQEARAAYIAACANPSATIATWRSWARFECRDVARARAVFREAAVRFPNDVEVFVQWSRAETDLSYARQVLHFALRRRPHVRLYHALGDLEATRAREQHDDVNAQLRALHAARRAFYRGAKISNGGLDLVDLLHSWAHCEWAISFRRQTTNNHTTRLLVWAFNLATTHQDHYRQAFVLAARANFERFQLTDPRTAAALAARTIGMGVDDPHILATAWNVLAHTAPTPQLRQRALENARTKDYDFEPESPPFPRSVSSHPAPPPPPPPGHPLKRQWASPPPLIHIRFGCTHLP